LLAGTETTLLNTTFFDNTADKTGGGIANFDGRTLTYALTRWGLQPVR
jgi:hypothetical protein